MELNAYIDHTLLKPHASEEDIKQLCQEALRFGFYSVCIPPYYVKYAKELLDESDVKVCTVVGFPNGYDPVSSKVETIKNAMEYGAQELDMVVNFAAMRTGSWSYVESELDILATCVHMKDGLIKAILETGLLLDGELERLVELATKTGIDFIKTSTGFMGGGADVESVRRMRKLASGALKIKAAGGISTRAAAVAMIEAGADRLGCSGSVKIMEEQ